MSDIEDFIASAQFDVERDSASDVIHAATLREWFSRWQASLQHGESEPMAWMFQHEDTGMVSIIDLQQIEWGYEAANPRWKKVSALYTTPQPVNTKPIAAVKGWFHGECIIQALDPEAVLPAGMALYAAPQPVDDVNQQLVADKYEKLEPALESLVDLCNNLNIGTYDEVIAAEAALERLYLARKALPSAGKGADRG